MIYCLRNVIYGFAILKSPFGMIQILRTTSGDVVLSFIFSKKIVHRRSLFHTPRGVYHRFAQQIYFTVGCAYPYAQPTKPGDLFYILALTVEIRMSPATTRSSAAKPEAKLAE